MLFSREKLWMIFRMESRSGGGDRGGRERKGEPVKILFLRILSGLREVAGWFGVRGGRRETASLVMGIFAMARRVLYGAGAAALRFLPFGLACAAYGGVFVLGGPILLSGPGRRP